MRRIFGLTSIAVVACVATGGLIGYSEAQTQLAVSSQSVIEEAAVEPYTRYVAAKEALAANDWEQFELLSAQLSEYALWPYLDYAAFNAQLATQTQQSLQAFIARHPDMPFRSRVVDDYLRLLAEQQRWDEFLLLQTQPPRTELYRCYYYQAKAETGQYQDAWRGAEQIWLTGRSISEHCRPLLAKWQAANQLTGELILQRMLLVFEAGSKARLNYLNKKLPLAQSNQGQQMVTLLDEPAGVGAFSKKSKVTLHNQQLVRLAFSRLVKQDIKQAIIQLNKVAQGQHFDERETQALREMVVRELYSSEDDELVAWRDRALLTSRDVTLLERRIRLALRHAERDEALRWIQRLPNAAQQTQRWVFWRGKLLLENGDMAGETLLRSLLGQRHFYSAAAATLLDEGIEFPAPDEVTLLPLDDKYLPAFERITELKRIDKQSSARLEWQYLLRRSAASQQLALAQAALQRGWYAESVEATISGQHWEHLAQRFPPAYQAQFDNMAKQTGTPSVTLMSISRQESAFNPVVESHAGARGLMQLMPATARATAKKHRLAYSGTASLYTPEVNIQLGSLYLTDMLAEMEGNRILAFASYNAGPHRVRQWLKNSAGELDVYEFIEAIPFYETRGYVMNVLMFEIYYNKLAEQPLHLLTEKEERRHY
ncbi:transglycosylase SLT domain-containing protein [Thaumasiovibrio sp. DFM-14]|uniref:transglycosylase SLT domain-containing protein n=1 Tax=Thaumasiovibrio sp. DFM-14 TaxID=3384792 RepID=UPI0039A1DBAC